MYAFCKRSTPARQRVSHTNRAWPNFLVAHLGHQRQTGRHWSLFLVRMYRSLRPNLESKMMSLQPVIFCIVPKGLASGINDPSLMLNLFMVVFVFWWETQPTSSCLTRGKSVALASSCHALLSAPLTVVFFAVGLRLPHEFFS